MKSEAESQVYNSAMGATTVKLTSADRCDRCGARAGVRVTLASGAELCFCAHHYRESRVALEALEGTQVDNQVDA